MSKNEYWITFAWFTEGRKMHEDRRLVSGTSRSDAIRWLRNLMGTKVYIYEIEEA